MKKPHGNPRTPASIGLAIVTGGLVFAGGTSANLLSDDSFEANDGSWAGGFGQYSHNSSVYYDGPAPAGAGEYYGWKWGGGTMGSVVQVVDLTAAVSPAAIDMGGSTFDFSVWLTSWTADPDYSVVSLAWNDATDGYGSPVGITIGFDGNNGSDPAIVGSANSAGEADPSVPWTQDNWTWYRSAGDIPPGARSAVITVRSDSAGGNGNDAYVDLASLTLVAGDPGPTGCPTLLTATLDDELGRVTLDWGPAEAGLDAAGIHILRDGSVLADLPLTAAAYVDFPPPPAGSSTRTYLYQVRPFGGSEGDDCPGLSTTVRYTVGGLRGDLVAYYPFEGDFLDRSGSATTHHGQPSGPPQFVTDGVLAHGIRLTDQADPHQVLNLGAGDDFAFGSDIDFSVSLWFRHVGSFSDNTAIGGGHSSPALISNKDWDSGGHAGWGIFGLSDGSVKWNFSDGSVRRDITLASGRDADAAADGLWHHVLVSHDRRGSAVCYYDGQPAGSSGIQGMGAPDAGMPLMIGADGTGLAYYYRGGLDEVAIWRRVLAPEEAREVYERGRDGATLTGYNLDDTDGDGLPDGWELAFFGDLAQDGGGDLDGDGRTHLAEFGSGSSPLIASADPQVRVTLIEDASSPTGTRIQAAYRRPREAPGMAYQLEYADEMDRATVWYGGDEVFTPAGAPIDLGGGMAEFQARLMQAPGELPGSLFIRLRMSAVYQGTHDHTVVPALEYRNGQAIITWATAEPSATILHYGYGDALSTRYEDFSLSTSHVVIIPDVQPGDTIGFAAVVMVDGVEYRTSPQSVDTFWDYAPPAVPDPGSYTTPGNYAAWAGEILSRSGVRHGYGLDLACGDGRLAYELVRQSELVVVAVESDPVAAEQARAFLNERGVYGARVQVVTLDDLNQLPFRTSTFNLIVSSRTLDGRQVLSDLAPVQWLEPYLLPDRGQGWFGLQSGVSLAGISRAPLSGSADWSHQYGAPDNTGFGGETLGGVTDLDQMQVQWVGRPGGEFIIDRMVRAPAPVVAGGRMYCQGYDRVVALDAGNGAALWARQIKDLRRLNVLRDCSNMCADDQGLYLAVKDACWKLTGDAGDRFTIPVVEGPRDDFTYRWGYVARSGPYLLGSAVKEEAPYTGFWGQRFWFDAQSGFGTDPVCSDNLFAVDPDTGDVHWTYENGLILNPTISVAGDAVYFLASRNPAAVNGTRRRIGVATLKTDLYLVKLSRDDGSVTWEQPVSFSGGTPVVYMMATADSVVLSTSEQSNDRYYLYAYNASDGSPRWNKNHAWRASHHAGNHQHPVVLDGRVYLEPNVYDLQTGALVSGSMPGRNGCSTFVATEHALFYRGRASGGQYGGNIAMWDPASGTSSAFVRVRPSCWISWAPAHGMLLVQEGGAGCSCGSWMETSFGMAPVTP